jgi:hypothetical protein
MMAASPEAKPPEQNSRVGTESSVMEGPFGNALGAHPLLRSAPNPRRRAFAWAAVVLVHVILLGIFVVSEKLPPRHRYLTPLETELLLQPQQRSNRPNVRLVHPLYPDETAPEITAPITLPPPPPAPPTAQEVLQSIGESMACGAGTYETLPAAERARCRHTPWHGKKLANGTMVLDALPKPPPPSTDFHISGGDFQRRQSQTANPCPILNNTPCIHRELYGDGPLNGAPPGQ